VDRLDFSGSKPDAVRLGERWHEILQTAKMLCRHLPTGELGTCVIGRDGELFRGSAEELPEALRNNTIRFHRSRQGGSWPVFR
jgi:hypothetical protein